ncbi:LysR family transcriptional regulator [Sinorhizobium medicae]|uniref:LysR family transcriptional regulator n=1 Tax=Sinorhizobium medicae TaxID=110321 RepID=UPI001AAD87A3|nr:LysR family transcriptional regulator [Sinorhizobium medicae]MBO1944518.1 LysR family transcriptional regulator [Sinorhizobium medicae]MDX0867147.1 LysR family transcriptional regulator [Sinorhizobium medicae]MDX0885154.1 LysR family transcriptional regulator [Sinorhizobium medicae]MDX0891911.1 LysR family transcriptional regulator [Sinorhizobium medicae]
MELPKLPLNALRAFEASARHCSFTRAGLELRVSQTAISHQVKALEDLLGVKLFRRLPRGLALTDEGSALAPVMSDVFKRMCATVSRFEEGNFQEVVTVGVVGTFAVGWLMERLSDFHDAHPNLDLRILSNNNRVDLAGDGLDFAIRFGDGSWHGTEAMHLIAAPLSPVCSPLIAARLVEPADLARIELLRSYRSDEWAQWFQAAGSQSPVLRGMMFETSLALAEAAARGFGAALLPVTMFEHYIETGRLVQPFEVTVAAGDYWLTWLKSRQFTRGMLAFKRWLKEQFSGPSADL